jgi:formylglycine-generating enzyme required for sulfatase activity
MTLAELASIEAWQSTPAERREELARDLASRYGLTFERVAPFRREDLPLASYRGLDGLVRFVLVPGGSFDMGLSDAELAHLAALAEPHRGEPSFEQAWGNLLVTPSRMRPVVRVTVEPCLFSQNTIGDFGLDEWRQQMGEFFVGEGGDVSTLPEDLEVALAAHGLRLPSEAEWEWCARGGRTGEITFKGNVVPDERHYRKISRELDRSEYQDEDRHAAIANDFGLLGFGVHAELCRDRYAVPPTLTPAGPGGFEDRVVRGGAGATYLWQNPGEWQALLTAFRQRAGGLLNCIGVRGVRSVG